MRFIVAAEDGSLKRIDANEECNASDKAAPLPESRELYRGNAKKRIQCMTCLSFPSPSRGDVDAIAAAFKDGSVSIIDADNGDLLASIPSAEHAWQDSNNIADEEASIVSIECMHGHLATCTNFGHARITQLSSLWSSGSSETVDIELPTPISVMRMHPTIPGVIAFGGKENDLQVWSSKASSSSALEAAEDDSDEDEDQTELWKSMTPVWKAKNVKNDELDLRVPVWISDIQFLSTPDTANKSSYKLLTTTRFRQLRIYDSSKARRPIQSLELSEYPISQVLLLKDHPDEVHAIFTDTHANIMHTNVTKGTILGAFKGFSGAVNSINLSSDGLSLLAGGMDTYLRLFDVEDHSQICSVYIGSRIIQCLQLPEEVVIKDEEDEDADGLGDEDDDVWEGLEEVEEPQTKRARRS